ncbi:hypothetical protein JB92DRAFT_3150193 [Gautieria morchelliformis]|nr:hypothetical protein JB92DRAFT_3150193 [Gautieria morchelliformis]
MRTNSGGASIQIGTNVWTGSGLKIGSAPTDVLWARRYAERDTHEFDNKFVTSPGRAPVRRSTSSVSAAPTSPPRPKATSKGCIISKGATARSPVSSPRAGPSPNGCTKTPTTPTVSGPSPRSSPSPSGELHANGRDALVSAGKGDTAKEARYGECDRHATLHAAELYADQSRMEEDVATRMDIAEKLRSQEAAEQPVCPAPSIADSIAPSEAQPTSPATPVAHPPTRNDVEVSDGPEITALKLELSTLSMSHTSLQMMVQMLQTELADLNQVNNELQQENESYGPLLMERAMNGRRSVLDRVSEDEEFISEGDHRSQIERTSLAWELQAGQGLEPPSSSRRLHTRQNSASSSPHGTHLGESLADLPITGPELDLTAELWSSRD